METFLGTPAGRGIFQPQGGIWWMRSWKVNGARVNSKLAFLKINFTLLIELPKGDVCFLLRLGRNRKKISPSVTCFRLLRSFFKPDTCATDARVHVAALRAGLAPLLGVGAALVTTEISSAAGRSGSMSARS